jgi:signal transduction histidine kinase
MSLDRLALFRSPATAKASQHEACENSENTARPSAEDGPRTPKDLAGRLHDDLSQWLVLASMRIDEAASGKHPEAHRQCRLLIQRALQSTRSVMAELVGQTLATDRVEDDLTLRLQRLVEELRHVHVNPMEFVCDGQAVDLPYEIGEALFQSARELLANALKHAGGSPIDIRIVARPGRVSITITDLGSGYAAILPGGGGGLGLPLLRRRLLQIGARLRWRCAGPQGVQARILWALPA